MTSAATTRPAGRSIDQPRPADALSLALPKGRIADEVERLLADAGWRVSGGERDYRPRCAQDSVAVKRMKSQNIPQLLQEGRHDIGFAGWDWAVETGAEIDEVMDLGTNPVRIVAAAPRATADAWPVTGRRLVIATEYVGLAERWAAEQGVEATIIRTYGATEVFPPEDADLIIDNSATGATLRENGLAEIDVLLRSSTRLFARPGLRDEPERWTRVQDLCLLLRASLDARGRVMLECNVSDDRLDAIIERLPCMRAPTVSQLWGEAGHAVKAAVPRDEVPALLPDLRRLGATDIIVSTLERLSP
jgi:ATP phosphoribosyltransferase